MRLNYYLAKGSLVGALGGLLFGFDTAVISGTTHQLTQVFSLTPGELGTTVSIALIGTVIGAISAGELGQKLGGREALRIMAVLYVISAIGSAFAWNWGSLLCFRLLGGLGIGGSSVLGPVYIAELAPAKWRGRMVGLFQINIVMGILLAVPLTAFVKIVADCHPSLIHISNLLAESPRPVSRWIETDLETVYKTIPFISKRFPAKAKP